MAIPGLDPQWVRTLVTVALEEDVAGVGDLTSRAVVPADRQGAGHVVARRELVVAGLAVAQEVFRQLDASLAFTARCADADTVTAGQRLATVRGRARAILTGERTALNVLMRMCGIATAARSAVREIEGTGARILDTRKTAPGLRQLDKYAVRVGGALNHRMGLYDAVMIKDTHLAVAGGVAQAVARCVAAGVAPTAITVEVRSPAELDEAIAAGAGRALLDNMELGAMREAVRRGKGRIVLEASGGLRPGALRAVADTGVDYLSLGWLTHSAPAADIAMEMEAEA
jgi:nicotinate-nucleotide pyrophosphorylase (carboxylating)